ncbi:CLCN3 [Cordylochernes scorpioides]|uniref:CLCN3 n=1 Tax=Cordylochernes scorpioides TaxID=51811 RepID=A0ABY6KBD6_9ARAC|nr:CLCN3 [Cordylochernes scorpioides]
MSRKSIAKKRAKTWSKCLILNPIGSKMLSRRWNMETKRQSSQWLETGELIFKKARMIKSKLKCLLITFFDVKGLVHYEFVPEGQSINQLYFLDVLRCLREAVHRGQNLDFQKKCANTQYANLSDTRADRGEEEFLWWRTIKRPIKVKKDLHAIRGGVGHKLWRATPLRSVGSLTPIRDVDLGHPWLPGPLPSSVVYLYLLGVTI